MNEAQINAFRELSESGLDALNKVLTTHVLNTCTVVYSSTPDCTCNSCTRRGRVQHMALERANFKHADRNGDQQLDQHEFTAFQHVCSSAAFTILVNHIIQMHSTRSRHVTSPRSPSSSSTCSSS